MNTSLLSCLRGADERLRRSLREEKRRRPLRFQLVRPFRVFSALTVMPLLWPRSAVFYLPSYPRPNTKYAAVFNELVNAGVPRSAFWYPPEAGNAPWSRLVRVLVRLPWALLFLLNLRRRVRRLDMVDVAVVLGRESFRRTLRKRHSVMPVIISDVGPTLHMLWSAAATEGNRAIWWQDDFHHQARLPYGIRAAAVLNEPGFAVAKMAGTTQLIARRPTPEPLPVREIPWNPKVGLATNARFGADAAQIQRLADIASYLTTECLHLRLHPNSTLNAADLMNLPVQLAPSTEPMDSFASRIDLAVVGNSASQLWLVRHGVPVVHIAGLDARGYDLYGYVARGFVYGCQDLSQLSLAAVRSFYSDVNRRFELVRRHTSIPCSEGLPGLNAFAMLLQGPVKARAGYRET